MRVLDGDTLVVVAGGPRVTVRRLGTHTPETHPARGCGGLAAGRRLARLAAAGTRVRLTIGARSDDTHDRSARLRAYVDSPDGDLGERQLRPGVSYVHRYRGGRFPRLDRYQRAQDRARAERRASWSACAGDLHSARPGRQLG